LRFAVWNPSEIGVIIASSGRSRNSFTWALPISVTTYRRLSNRGLFGRRVRCSIQQRWLEHDAVPSPKWSTGVGKETALTQRTCSFKGYPNLGMPLCFQLQPTQLHRVIPAWFPS
jgi:hypothetical protein